jgi:hypothetical protein
MLSVPPSIGQAHQSNVTAASTVGTTVTADASANTKGNYASLIDPTSNPSYGIWVEFVDVAVATAIQNVLVDIAYGPTGGGNELIVLPDLNAGEAPDHTTHVGGKTYFFPVYIPTGVRVSARCAASTGGDTVITRIILVQNPLYEFTCGLVSVYGRDATNSRGTSVTPGSNAFGNWTELLNAAAGSGLTRPHRFWTAMIDGLADTSLFDDRYEVLELGVGPNSGAVTTIAGPFLFGEEGGETVVNSFPILMHGTEIVDSTNLKLWARMSQTGATEARGVMAWGCD